MEHSSINLASQSESLPVTKTVPSGGPIFALQAPVVVQIWSPWATGHWATGTSSHVSIVSWVCAGWAPSCFSPSCPPDGSSKQKRKHWEIMSLMYSKIGN